jgi:DNA-binding LacI/PurR family transcriptional regulator
VPEELKLVLYRNVETAAFCPVPAAFVEISLADVGRAAVEQVRGQLRGERGARVLLPARLCQNGRGMTPGKMSAPAEESLA